MNKGILHALIENADGSYHEISPRMKTPIRDRYRRSGPSVRKEKEQVVP